MEYSHGRGGIFPGNLIRKSGAESARPSLPRKEIGSRGALLAMRQETLGIRSILMELPPERIEKAAFPNEFLGQAKRSQSFRDFRWVEEQILGVLAVSIVIQ